MTPIELKRRLEAGDQLMVVDLRTPLDIETISYGIPGARWMSLEALDDPQREAMSARMALLLDRHGYRNVHPLSGGLEGWRQAGFVVEPLHIEAPPDVTPR